VRYILFFHVLPKENLSLLQKTHFEKFLFYLAVPTGHKIPWQLYEAAQSIGQGMDFWLYLVKKQLLAPALSNRGIIDKGKIVSTKKYNIFYIGLGLPFPTPN